ncbi:unnamed protein product [Cyclocybe aegerita]|uniref:F-box domain-containing protein n=1 Tax=Cyclocybe aegerita TaxID=1973307 RepID=A0A8S0VYQ8_CYCAE|nr:unnamed protein product [Cyclocybe aegerita]
MNSQKLEEACMAFMRPPSHTDEPSIPPLVEGSSPIAILPQDILWLIFSFITKTIRDERYPASWNIEKFQYYLRNTNPRHTDRVHRLNPMVVLKRTSQVCRKWREILLNAPSLWAQVIDITVLSWAPPWWWEEVTRRTGDALVSIRGKAFVEPNDPLSSIILSFLAQNWHRMREVEVSVLCRDTIEFGTESQVLYKADALIGAQSSAPYLESISLDLAHLYTSFPLEAPSLREFHSAPYPPFNPQSLWIPQLRALSLNFNPAQDCPSPTFTLLELFNALKRMTALNSLNLQGLGFGKRSFLPLDGLFPNIVLPNLSKILIQDDLQTCICILKHITPKDGCSLRLRAKGNHSQENIISLLQNIVGRYSRHHIFGEELEITCWNSLLRISDGRLGTPSRFPLLFIDISWDRDPDGPVMNADRAIPFLTGIPLNVNRVKTLHLQTAWDPTSTLVSQDRRLSLLSFFGRFNSVVEFKSSEPELVLLSRLSEHHTEPLLPKLQSIQLSPGSSVSSVEFYDSFIKFRNARKDQGLALISTLDLTPKGCLPGGQSHLPNIVCLDSLTGLKVLYVDCDDSFLNVTVQEYICGSGSLPTPVLS